MYVRNGCWENPDHVSNIESNSYEDILHLAMSHFQAAVASIRASNIRRVFDVYQQFGHDNYTAKNLDTDGGLSIWLSWDPVHLTDTVYMEIGILL